LWIYFKPAASFEREKADATSSSSNSDSYGKLLNSLDETTATYRRQWGINAEIDGRWRLPLRPEDLNFGAGVKWSDRRLETTTNRRLLFPQQPELNEFNRPQEFMPERKLEADAKISYGRSYKVSKLLNPSFSFNYTYKHQGVNSTRDYYLLQDSDQVLPSVTDAIRNAGFIASNSYDYTLNDDNHALRIALGNGFPPVKSDRYPSNFNAAVNLHYAPGSISYQQAGTEYFARRRVWYAEPELRFGMDDIGNISYKYKASLPNLRDLLDVTDAANPLFIFIGNSDLKMTRTHEIYLNIYHIVPKGPGLEVTYNNYRNMIAQAADYNMTTGVTTYKPVNVDGNWDISAILSSPYQWRRLKNWQPDLNIRALYQNSVDLIGLNLSTVRNFSMRGKASLTYKIIDGMEIVATGNSEWRKVTSPMADFDPISAVDFDYGFIFRAVKLPWNISVTTDLIMHSRRGYGDSRLNTNDLVWNARVAKSICQGNLTFALDGFDILGQLSNVRLTMNSQGRTEARYNTLPRYVMLHAIYRLNIKPKKK
ncbi:MAG: outer membrane beta-barrel family protein, partial [Paramuribaculum sp.]|nr:outer membrane beta-barrel family protein [Paramuribaculum sp.]